MAATLVLVEIGERLRRQRKKLKMTQEDTAELLEMSTTFYGEIERGNKRLSIEKILLVYERMGLDPTYLLTGELTSDKTVVEDCPKDKTQVLEQILENLTKLYK